MCHVLRSTFENHFTDIETSIKNAEFVAIDAEFTGLTIDGTEKGSLFDSGADRYVKLKKNVSQFIICQIGISSFVKSSSSKRTYDAHTYNFYTFPTSLGGINPGFWCQASSLKFLYKHGFDFNVFVNEGVSFMNDDQECQLLEEIRQDALFTGVDRDIDERALQKNCSDVAEWSVKAKDGERKTLQCSEDLPSYVLLRELQARFPDMIAYPGTEEQVVIEKVSQEQIDKIGAGDGGTTRQAGHATKSEEEAKIVNSMLGFTRVFRLLAKYKKPLVGHNMFLDLMLMYDKFHKPLPSKYEKFKEDVHNLFPCIYDTKHISASLRRPLLDGTGLAESTNLSTLFEQLSSNKGQFTVLYSPGIRHADGFDRYSDKKAPHEAGYDAYMAGCVFIRLSHVAGLYGTKSTEMKPLEFRDYLQVVAPYKNSVNVIRASVDHVVFGNPDPPSRRPRWLFIRSKKSSWKLNSVELASEFSSYGCVDIRLQSTRQGLVAVGNYRCAKDILKAYHNHERLHVAKYNVLRHSPVIRRLLWSGLAVSGGLLLWALLSPQQDNS